MHVHRFAKTVAVFLGVFALSGASPLHLKAQGNSHAHNDKRESGSDQKRNPGALVAAVREATERYKNVAVAEADGYSLQFGCVTGPDWGAMGLHYVNFPLVLDGELDPAKPEIVIYEPAGNGKVRMIGADFLVLADAWHAKNPGPPELMGQLMHLFEAPNRFGLPAFYTLHVWAWKDNPAGTFVNWHSNVSCDAFPGKQN